MNIFQDRHSQGFKQKNYTKNNQVPQKLSTAAKNSKPNNSKPHQEQNKSKQSQSIVSNIQSFSTKSQKLSQNKAQKKIKIGNNIQTEINYGIYNQYRLDEFFNIEKNLQQGQVIPIATIESHALHLQQKFLNLMEKYNEYDIAFVGFYGPKNSGKSLLLDKILNLATFQGSHFTQTKNPKSKKQICLWSVPVSRGKEKIFIVDCTGYGNDKEKMRQDEMLLDFLLFLCSDIVLIQPFNDQNSNFVSDFVSMIKGSISRIHYNKIWASKESFFWPGFFSVAYRNNLKDDFKHLKKYFLRSDFRKLGDAKDSRVQGNLQSEQLKQIFLQKYADRNKIMLNESYIKTASQYLLSFYENCQVKFYNDILPNGNGISTILMNFVLGINCKEKVNIFSVIQRTRKQILVDAYNSTVNWYTRQLQKYFGKEEAQSSKQLISIFEKVFYKAFTYFQKRLKTSLKIDPSDQQLSRQIIQLQEKLQKYIRQKQFLILKINQKKTTKTLKTAVDKKIDIKQMPMREILQLREILYRFKTIERHLDMNRLNSFKEKMIEGWDKFIFNEQLKNSAQVQRLQQKLQTKRSELKGITQRNLQAKTKIAQTMQKYNELNRQSTELHTNIQNMKFEINIHKRANLQRLQNSYQRIHLTARNQQQLTNQLKEYEKKLQKSSITKDEELKSLKDELEQAYRIQAEELKKISLPSSIPLNSNNLYGYNSLSNLGKKTLSNYQLPSQQKLDSLKNLPSLEEVSMVGKKQKQNEVFNSLLKSRIAKNTESVRLLKYQIDQKVKNQQELQDKISNNFISFSRLTTEYRNNQIRGSQSRKIKVQNSNKKQVSSNDRENEQQAKRLFQSGKKNDGASQPAKGIFANLI